MSLIWMLPNAGSTVPMRLLYVARPVGASSFLRTRSMAAFDVALLVDSGPTRSSITVT